jgi:type IV secretion system protein VirB4
VTDNIRSTTELLPWIVPITDGLVVCKDSSLLACWEFTGADADTVGEGEVFQIAAAAERMLLALRGLPVTLWWTVRRERTEEYPGLPMPDPVSQLIDDEHRRAFLASGAFRNRHFLSIAWAPERSTVGAFEKLGGLMAEGASFFEAAKLAFGSMFGGQQSFAWKAAEMERLVNDIEAKLAQVQSILSALSPRRLYGAEMLGFLWAQANPGVRMTPKTWDTDQLLDAYLPEGPITVGRDVLQFGDVDPVYGAAISMKSWPRSLAFDAFGGLLSMPCEMIVSHCFRVMPPDAANKHIESVKRLNDYLKYPLKSWIFGLVARRGHINESNIDLSRAAAANDALEAKAAHNGGHVIFGWHNLSVVLLDRNLDTLEGNARELLRMFYASPFVGAVRESLGLLSAWAVTLPGQWQECKRWMAISSANMADVAPLLGVSEGERINKHISTQLERQCPALTVLTTDANTPFHFNFHAGAIGHTLVLGPTRSGKSIGMNFLISQFRKYAPASRILIFDKDHSCRIPTLLQGGEHVDLREGGEIRLNPMAMARDPRTHQFLAEWIEGLISSRGYQVTSEDSKHIIEAIRGTAANPMPDTQRLYTVRALLPPHLGVHLDPWVGTGQYAQYFDNLEDGFQIADFMCVEMGEIMRNPRVARAFMDYAFFRLQQALEAQRHEGVRITMVYVEECWFLLDDEQFAARLKDWLKTFAKLNAFLVLTTQSIEDMEALPPAVFASIRDNIATKIFLPNPNAATEKLAEFYRRNFDLREDLVQRIARGVPRQDYLIVRPDVSRKVRLMLTPVQVAALRSDIAAQRIFAEHYATQAPGWQMAYIDEVLRRIT